MTSLDNDIVVNIVSTVEKSSTKVSTECNNLKTDQENVLEIKYFCHVTNCIEQTISQCSLSTPTAHNIMKLSLNTCLVKLVVMMRGVCRIFWTQVQADTDRIAGC